MIDKKFVISVIKKLSSLINGNIEILEAINIIEEDFEKEKHKNKLSHFKREIKKGNSLSKAFINISNEREFLAYIKMAEKSQNLKKILKILSLKYEKREKIKREIISLIIYPVVVIVISFVLISILLIFIMPNFISFYQNADNLPYITKLAILIKDKFIFIISFLTIKFFLIYIFLKKNKKYLLYFNIIKEIEILNICENIYSFLEAEIDFLKGMEISKTSNNDYVLNIIDKIIHFLKKGNSLTVSFEKSNFFSNEFLAYLKIGEKTANFKLIFKNLKEKYEDEVNLKIRFYLKLIEPFSLVLISIIISFFLIAMMLPIIKIGEILK